MVFKETLTFCQRGVATGVVGALQPVTTVYLLGCVARVTVFPAISGTGSPHCAHYIFELLTGENFRSMKRTEFEI
jgi:hypothetical protein